MIIQHTGPQPHHGSVGAAGWDLQAKEDRQLYPGAAPVLIPTGLSIALRKGYVGLVCPRSGLSMAGVLIANAPGIIDSDYRGEIKVLLYTTREYTYYIDAGTRIAQLVILPTPWPVWQPVEELPSTERGAGGFGSTGMGTPPEA